MDYLPLPLTLTLLNLLLPRARLLDTELAKDVVEYDVSCDFKCLKVGAQRPDETGSDELWRIIR